MKKSKNQLIQKGDVWILLFCLSLAVVLYLYAGQRTEGESVSVTVRGETTIYPLGEDTVISLNTGTKDYNTVVVENRTVFMKNASCPDQICVHHKAVSKDGETIICLPNQVFIEIESAIQSDVDN